MSSLAGYDQFVEVYSISDLHLADGASVDSFAVNHLAEAIDALRLRSTKLPQEAPTSTGKAAALVVNGDSVDFLAVQPSVYFDAAGATEKLERVFRANPAFWAALRKFSETGTVVFTLGNHDVELALPECQAMLRREITGSLVLAFDGAGYRCKVGETNALFLHGNNEDDWNLVDYDRLGRIAAARNAGNEGEKWDANQGTKLVIEVLNEQKAKHPFVEYVKPETRWLLELIDKLGFATLTDQYWTVARRLPVAWASGRHHSWTRSSAYLGATATQLQPRATLFDSDDLLFESDRRYRAGERVLASSDPGSGSLRAGARSSHQRAPDPEIKRHILDALVGDTTFLPAQTDEIYQKLRSKVHREVHWVICGHTHLRRAYQERSNRAYLNSGTWMRLLDLYTPSSVAGQFAQVLKALDARTLTELDAIRWTDEKGLLRPIVLRQPTIVVLRQTPGGAEGWLGQWSFDKDGLLDVEQSKLQVTL